jgi:hypothetical protein
VATDKLGLALAVALLAVSALWTCAAGIAGIHDDNSHPSQLRLVLDKQAELTEGPSVSSGSLIPPNRGPFADSREVFKGYRTTSAFGGGNDTLADSVVHIPSEKSLVPTHALEMPLGASGAATLKPGSEGGESLSAGLDYVACVRASIGVGGETNDSEVHADSIFWLDRRSIGQINRDVEKELSAVLAVHEIGLPLDVPATLLVVLAEDAGQKKASRDGVDANPVRSLERQDAIIVDHGGMRLKRGTYFLVALKGLDGLADGPDGELRGQAIFGADVGVAPPVDRRLRKYLCLKGNLRGEGRCRVKLLHSLEKDRLFFTRDNQFGLQRQLHVVTLRQVASLVKVPFQEGGSALPLSLKSDSLRAVH